MFCTQCGQQNPDGSRFCARCGAAMARPSGEAPVREAVREAARDAPAPPADGTSTISLAALEHALEAEGVVVAEPADAGAAGLDPLPPGDALLVVKRGPNAGSRFLLAEETTTAGRHPDSDIFLDDVTVSRRHAEFVQEPGGWTVRDVGSLNGTYLNRERIDAAPLSGGDEVQIGKYRLVFLAGPRPGELG